MFEGKAQRLVTETRLRSRTKQLGARSFKELAILNSRGADLFAGAAAETTIDVPFKGIGSICESAFSDSAHKVKTPAWSIVLVAGNDVGGARLETEAAVNTCEQLLLFGSELGC